MPSLPLTYSLSPRTPRPARVETAAGSVEFLYTASGVKLAETVRDPQGNSLVRRDFIGSLELADDTVYRYRTAEGFFDRSGAFHAFIPDYQGNIVGVVNTATSALEQLTHYYPYGMPWASSTAPALNRHKFGAKEFVTDLGLNAFDFGARFYNPATAHWMAPDPLAGILSDPQNGESLKTPYLSNVSPTAYCAAEPVNLIDPTGMSPIYSTSGIFLGCSSEGFTGDIIIYLGDELFDFHKYTSEQLLTGKQWDFVLYDAFRNTNLMKPGAHSNIWTHIIGYFNNLCVFDEIFSIDKIKGSIIRLQQRENAHWATYLCSNSLPEIIGTNDYEYESTVENIASSLIVHEWYSHGMKGVLDNLKSHRLAYKAVINFKPFWKNTTERYKSFVLKELYKFTVKETGKNQVDKPYRRLYYKYCKPKE